MNCTNQQIDFGKTAPDYSKHRAGFPEAFFEQVATFGVGRSGQRLLDLGTGTGTLARGFARRGCEVTALDPSEPLLEQAKLLDQEAEVTIRYVAHLSNVCMSLRGRSPKQSPPSHTRRLLRLKARSDMSAHFLHMSLAT